MTTVLNGLLGGLVAIAVTELVVRGFGLSPIPTWTAGAGDATDETSGTHRLRDTVIRLLSGSVAGGALVALELYVLGVLAVPPELGVAVLTSVGWSLLLFVVSMIGRGLVSGTRPHSVVGTFVPYLVFGVALGLWIRLTWIT